MRNNFSMRLCAFLALSGITSALALPRLHSSEDTYGTEMGVSEVIQMRSTQTGPGEPTPRADALTAGWVAPGSQTFIDISTYHHNVHRANHSAPYVRWNTTLGQWAQNKANTCQYNNNLNSNWGDLGINIAGGTYHSPATLPNPSDMITGLWYNSEVENYPRYGVGNPNYSNFENWGHFSQLVWPQSYQIGCGLQQCNGNWFGLCLYSPPGNWDGEFNIIHRPNGYRIVYPNGQ